MRVDFCAGVGNTISTSVDDGEPGFLKVELREMMGGRGWTPVGIFLCLTHAEAEEMVDAVSAALERREERYRA